MMNTDIIYNSADLVLYLSNAIITNDRRSLYRLLKANELYLAISMFELKYLISICATHNRIGIALTILRKYSLIGMDDYRSITYDIFMRGTPEMLRAIKESVFPFPEFTPNEIYEIASHRDEYHKFVTILRNKNPYINKF